MIHKYALLVFSFLFFKISAFANCDASFTMDIDEFGDTVCAGVLVTFHNTSDLNGEAIAGSFWDFGDNSPIENGEIVTHAFAYTGFPITIRLNTASNSCTSAQTSRTITVIPPPGLQGNITNPKCFGYCDGAASVFITGAHTNYSTEWSDGQNTPIAVGLCDGVYTVTVSDIYGCSVISSPYTLTQPDTLIADAGPDIFICIGDAPFKIHGGGTGGTGPYSFNWDPINGLDDPTADHPFITATDTSYGTFYLTITDSKGCVAEDGVEVQKVPADIGGTITTIAGDTVFAGEVYLIKVGAPDEKWIYLDTVPISAADGSYYFPSVPIDDVVILAKPQSGAMPTYYNDIGGGTPFWDEAFHIAPLCDMFFLKNIKCVVPEPQNGTCDFKGKVFIVGVGKTQTEDPIPFIDVVVKKTPPGNAVAHTQTGSVPNVDEGIFTFSGIEASPDSAYSFVVSITGLTMHQNDTIEVSANDLEYNNINFYVVTDTLVGPPGIYMHNITGINHIMREDKTMIAFPNPFSDNCELRFPNPDKGKFNFALFDLTGKMLANAEEQEGVTYLVKTETLERGIYIAEVSTSTEVFRSRIIKQ